MKDNKHVFTQEREGYPRPKWTLKRSLALVAVVIFILAASFSTTMAVSENFREMVFAFLEIEEPVTVPSNNIGDEITPQNMQVDSEKTDIGGVIEGTYVHTPETSHGKDGLFLICTDNQMMKGGSHFDAYIEKNGQLKKLDEHSFSHDYTILGNDFHVEFMWVEHNGKPTITYVDAQVPYWMPSLSGNVNASLVLFSCSTIDDSDSIFYTEYPVLIDLKTGALTDVLAGTGAESLPNISNAAISDDLSKMLLVSTDGTIYYADLSGKKLYNVEVLSGEQVDECSLIGNVLACWVLVNDSIETASLGSYRAWTINLSTMGRTELFGGIPATASTSHDVWSETYDLSTQVPDLWPEIGCGELAPLSCAGLHFIDGFDTEIHGGNMYSGSRFAVDVDEDRRVYVIDLATGEKAMIEGFVWPDAEYPNIECIPSPDGEKLLIEIWDNGVYEQLGVLDFSKRTYVQLARENLNDVNEHIIYWFDNDSVIICADSAATSCDYYVYSLLD